MTSRGTVAVAVSGGRDSTALLHSTAHAARAQGLQVLALHVHHGLMPQADDWWAHLSRQCARWRSAGLPVRFVGTRLAGRPQPGDSVEAWARRERYKALAVMAQEGGASLILLAHHQRDQAETFLLQALRGAGPRGLSSMPREAFRDGLLWCRPWLEQPSQAIDRYVRRHRLKVVDDQSNADPRYARSRLRVHVWPALIDAFPEAEQALHAAARRAQESSAILADMAAADGALCCDDNGNLRAKDWENLSLPRRANLMRHWLRLQAGRGLPESLVERLLKEWPAAGAGHRWPAPGGMVHSGRGSLMWQADAMAKKGVDPHRAEVLDLSRPGSVPAPGWGGHWVVQLVKDASELGLDARLLRRVQLRERQGSERFQFHPRSQPRSLKKQFQAAGIAAAQRTGPLVFAADQLVYVPGLGMDARVLGAGGRGRLTLQWVQDAPA